MRVPNGFVWARVSLFFVEWYDEVLSSVGVLAVCSGDKSALIFFTDGACDEQYHGRFNLHPPVGWGGPPFTGVEGCADGNLVVAVVSKDPSDVLKE